MATTATTAARTDGYGGSFAARARCVGEVALAELAVEVRDDAEHRRCVDRGQELDPHSGRCSAYRRAASCNSARAHG